MIGLSDSFWIGTHFLGISTTTGSAFALLLTSACEKSPPSLSSPRSLRQPQPFP